MIMETQASLTPLSLHSHLEVLTGVPGEGLGGRDLWTPRQSLVGVLPVLLLLPQGHSKSTQGDFVLYSD